MRKSDGVRVHHKRRRDWVRDDHEKKSDGLRVHHEKERWGKFTIRKIGVRVDHEKNRNGVNELTTRKRAIRVRVDHKRTERWGES